MGRKLHRVFHQKKKLHRVTNPAQTLSSYGTWLKQIVKVRQVNPYDKDKALAFGQKKKKCSGN
jgi:hypothetical protein